MEKELQELERRLAQALTSSVVPMDTVLRYVGSVSGKRLRPKLVFLSARLFGEINERVMRTALFVELLHTATLIHDDVVDASSTRRGQPSVNARWDNKTAVLAGDYLLSKAMLLLAEPEDNAILKEMMRMTMEMSEGEVMQSEDCGIRNAELGIRNAELASGGNNSEFRIPNSELYLGVIRRKTAALMRACCVGGALGGTENGTPKGSPTEWEVKRRMDLIGEFGVNFGMAFQMRDDIMDDDDPEITAMAKTFLPEYLDKAYKALDAMEPRVRDTTAIEELRLMVASLQL